MPTLVRVLYVLLHHWVTITVEEEKATRASKNIFILNMSQFMSKNCGSLKLENLPSDILIEILKRLSAHTLAKAKLTCKAWNTIISDSKFVDLHLEYSTKYPGYLHSYCTDIYDYFTEESRLGEQDIKIYLRTKAKQYLNSSGGLVAYKLFGNNFVYVCNPITGEELRVALHRPLCGEGFEPNWCGLGYSPSSKEYKILQLVTPKGVNGHVSKGAIYTIGSGLGWREINSGGDIPYFFYKLKHLYFEGRLFWIVSRRDERNWPNYIVSFDVGSERFKLLKSPNTNMCFSQTKYRGLLLIGQTVAFTEICDDYSYNIWMLRDMINDIWVNEMKIPPTMFLLRRYYFFGDLKFRLNSEERGDKYTFEFVLHVGSLVSPNRVRTMTMLRDD